MALLSSVFGSALGAAAKVGSREIRESRERDRLSMEEFKQNVQKKKEAFAKQQAAAQKKAAEIDTIAKFLGGMDEYKGLNAMELNDLAIQLDGMSGDKSAIEFYTNNIKDGTLTLQPAVRRAVTQKDIGLVDGRPVAPQTEVERLSLVKAREKQKQPSKVGGAPASLLKPVRERSFLQTALVGRDPGALQRDALASMGMTEQDLNAMMSAKASFPESQDTAYFKIGKGKRYSHLLERIDKTHDTLVSQAFDPSNAELLDRTNTISVDVPSQTEGTYGMGGAAKAPTLNVKVGDPVKAQKNPYYHYLEVKNQFDLLDDDLKNDPQNLRAMLDTQAKTIMQFGNVKAKSELETAFDNLYKDKYDKIINNYTGTPINTRNEINFTERLANIHSLMQNKTNMMISGNYQQALTAMNAAGKEINKLFLDMKPEIQLNERRDSLIYGSTNRLLADMEGTAGIFDRMQPGDKEIFITLREKFNDAVTNDNKVLNKEVFDAAMLIQGRLKAPAGTTMGEKEKNMNLKVAALLSQWKEENPNAGPEETAQAEKFIKRDVLSGILDERFKGADGVFYQKKYTFQSGPDGFVQRRLIEVPTVVGNAVLHPGMSADDWKKANEKTVTYFNSGRNVGFLIQAAQKDGLIFGSIANIRRSYGNIKDTLRAIEQLTTGTNFFVNLKNNDAYLQEINQMVTAFVGAAKDELFDDPRLSDQDLALVINYIGLLNRPGEFNVIGQSNAIAALIGLEKIFLKQQALNELITRGRNYGAAIREGDYVGEQVNFEKDSIARKLYMQVAANRGIDLKNFMDIDDNLKSAANPDGLAGFNRDKIFEYFKNSANKFGYSTKGKELSGQKAYDEFIKTLDEIDVSVEYALKGANEYVTYGNFENGAQTYRRLSATSGILHSVSTDREAINRTIGVLNDLDPTGVATRKYMDRVNSGKIVAYGVNFGT